MPIGTMKYFDDINLIHMNVNDTVNLPLIDEENNTLSSSVVTLTSNNNNVDIPVGATSFTAKNSNSESVITISLNDAPNVFVKLKVIIN